MDLNCSLWLLKRDGLMYKSATFTHTKHFNDKKFLEIKGGNSDFSTSPFISRKASEKGNWRIKEKKIKFLFVHEKFSKTLTKMRSNSQVNLSKEQVLEQSFMY